MGFEVQTGLVPLLPPFEVSLSCGDAEGHLLEIPLQMLHVDLGKSLMCEEVFFWWVFFFLVASKEKKLA